MAQPRATFMTRPRPTQIDTIQVDVAMSETHSGTNTVTDNPVERGANIADHSHPDADTLTMECIISNSPATQEQMQRAQASGEALLDPFATGGQQTISAQPGYAEGQYEKLKRLKDQGQLLKVITSLRDYDNMEITALSAKRDVDTSNSVEFSISFKQVRIVDNKLTTVESTNDVSAQKKKKTGTQTPQEDEVTRSKLLQADEADDKAKAEGKGVLGVMGAVGGSFLK